jgi:hypothetical protein
MNRKFVLGATCATLLLGVAPLARADIALTPGRYDLFLVATKVMTTGGGTCPFVKGDSYRWDMTFQGGGEIAYVHIQDVTTAHAEIILLTLPSAPATGVANWKGK